MTESAVVVSANREGRPERSAPRLTHTRLDPILGEMKRCARCREWWPLDEEFYYPSNPAYCKACWVEYHRSGRATEMWA